MLEPIGGVLNSNSYSSSKEPKNTVTVTVSVSEVIKNLSDLINPDDPYMPKYIKRYRELGYHKYMWLAGKARASGKDPARLFSWMLDNPDLVR
jgi:hypothetical protein